jgi:hypothetical protein
MAGVTIQPFGYSKRHKASPLRSTSLPKIKPPGVVPTISIFLIQDFLYAADAEIKAAAHRRRPKQTEFT